MSQDRADICGFRKPELDGESARFEAIPCESILADDKRWTVSLQGWDAMIETGVIKNNVPAPYWLRSCGRVGEARDYGKFTTGWKLERSGYIWQFLTGELEKDCLQLLWGIEPSFNWKTFFPRRSSSPPNFGFRVPFTNLLTTLFLCVC